MKAKPFLQTAWIVALLLAVIECGGAQGKIAPETSVDLRPFGIPRGFFQESERCKHTYNFVRSLIWLDENRLVFAFSTNPECSDIGGPVSAAIRIISFELNGKKLASQDIPYEAGDGGAIRLSPANDVHRGPDNTIVVQSMTAQSAAQLSLFSQNLEPLQKLDLPRATTFEGVTSEHHWIILQTPGANLGKDYTYYSGVPLAPVGEFSATRTEGLGQRVGENQIALISCAANACNRIRIRRADNSSWSYTEPKKDHGLIVLDWLADGSLLIESRRHASDKDSQVFVLQADGIRMDLPRIPPPYWAAKSFGFSSDGSRIAIGGFYVNASCDGMRDMFPIHCNEKRRLFILDQSAGKIIFERPLPGPARAALSPDGHHLSVVNDEQLLIYTLP
jgi:hypothetical protein